MQAEFADATGIRWDELWWNFAKELANVHGNNARGSVFSRVFCFLLVCGVRRVYLVVWISHVCFKLFVSFISLFTSLISFCQLVEN